MGVASGDGPAGPGPAASVPLPMNSSCLAPRGVLVTTEGSSRGFRRWLGFPCGSAGEESAYNAGDLGLIPGMGRSPREGKGHPLQ